MGQEMAGSPTILIFEPFVHDFIIQVNETGHEVKVEGLRKMSA